MSFLLDTCTLIWLATEPEKLSRPAEEAIVDQRSVLYLSAVSAWEICLKASRLKLDLGGPPARIIPELRAQYAIEPLPLDEASVLHSISLPNVHSDPFDRLLVCQAIQHGLTLLTPDDSIHRYPVRCLW
jgi:PIN domain nuclease of toxin-antitoxin system